MSHQTGIQGIICTSFCRYLSYLLLIEVVFNNFFIQTDNKFIWFYLFVLLAKGYCDSFVIYYLTANSELKKYFSKCRDGKIRLLKVSIENGNILSYTLFL